MSITAIPMAMESIPIFEIADDVLPLLELKTSRLAMKYSKFNQKTLVFSVKNTILPILLLLLYSWKPPHSTIKTGADQPEKYLPKLKNKRVAIIANPSSIVQTRKYNIHLVDFLLEKKINVQKVFAPEHGFRGDADAGEQIQDGIDRETGLPVLSLYGKQKTIQEKDLSNIDILIFDIQDVGVRFYTYISTLHYVMQAAAKYHKPLLLLDRPNPNGYYIDGPVLRPEYQSFVGIHTVPVVYGMTIGEYATMINGESWIGEGLHCQLHIVKLRGYTHQSNYSLPIPPSPNLLNDKAIHLYPSLCFFEGTNVSVGRGTDTPFEVFGSPFLPYKEYSFVPEPNRGSKYPKYQGIKCYGKKVSSYSKRNKINLQWLIDAYKDSTPSEEFFNVFFEKLSGTETLRKQIAEGYTESQIRSSWQEDLNKFKKIRKKYLLYD